MKKIASHGDIEIFAPDNSRFSFLKSPYAAHMTHSAVDIYYGDFGSDAVSPVDGEVIDVRSFNAPTPFKDRDSKEYVIAIRQKEHVVKILHIKPDVERGENISKGDKIGAFIHNGYFIFWNDPVMHVEVRKPDDYLRASNDLHLSPGIEWSRLPARKDIELECSIECINKRYALLCAPYEAAGEVRGFAVDGGFLDGYVPSGTESGFFGIVKQQGFSHPQVAGLGITEGEKEIECAGAAFCLHFNEPRIKVLPLRYGDELFSGDGEVRISLEVR
ncbi:MAG: hypothetical protein OIN66_01870 [Candidatus Methanoperedens sp.]|nr:hypothetical protein [Candidatus Methanoperedens sp.]